MNNHSHNREKLISRIKKELIGGGSDLFECGDKVNFIDEVIEGKPLQRYYSAILFPKQKSKNGIENAQENEDDETDIELEIIKEELELTSIEKAEQEKSNQEKNTYDNKTAEDDRQTNYTSNTFFPSQYGLSFCINKECQEIEINLSFGNYKKAKYTEVSLPYNGDSVQLLVDFGLNEFAYYDEENKLLKIAKDVSKEDRIIRNDRQKAMSKDHRNSDLFKTITKLFFKDKYKRYHNDIKFIVSISDVLNAENNHLKLCLSKIKDVNTEHWHKNQKEYLWLHLKLYDNNNTEKYFIKAVLENSYPQRKDQFSNSKEKLNQICLFQTEIKVCSSLLLPFNDYKNHLYKSDEDKMLDYLYQAKTAYGIGHNTACTWEKCSDDTHKSGWVSTTFLPEYDVKSQSTETNRINTETLLIKQLSSFSNDKNTIIPNLKKLSDAYSQWIKEEIGKANGNDLALINVEKCKKIHQRICKGITLLETNDDALRAFQLANTAIYLQMFQTELNFQEKDGYEAYQNRIIQYKYDEYSTIEYPNLTRIPTWRPFQLAFILQVLPSFIEEKRTDTELVDLLYFPTGGGKTEAYLAVSAFLIFWRRLQHPNSYGGVNIIIRYTLRLLSAQQFERATKLILACEFIRQNHKDLGNEKITIGFWVGNSTIPNKLEEAKKQLANVQKRLNEGRINTSNPFQITNCQWCNTKTISKVQENLNFEIGHRIGRGGNLQTFCLNSNCTFCEGKQSLPIVVVDEDIYDNPPTILFATVDKFAQLAWKGEASTLFNSYADKSKTIQNRKPELIIQDELHLLNGPLGSLVGLFENVILSLCTTEEQRPKIIASTATIKNVDKQIEGLYGKNAAIFPQYITNADDTFFSKTQDKSKRRYIGILPTGKTNTMTNLRLNATLLLARLEIWEQAQNKTDADGFWTILSYFKSLKDIGRFSNKINAELQPEIQQLQVRHLKNTPVFEHNYRKLSYRNLELTSRIPNDKIKKNLDRLNTQFDGNLQTHNAFDIVLATNMISVGLDVGRLNIMLMNGMPPNTAEYIQASSRVARSNEGVVFTLYDSNNTRDLSYFEDFILFHKTFYKQVEPLSVTPFAENALDKMLFTLIIAYFRHKLGFTPNNQANALTIVENKNQLREELSTLFNNHTFAKQDLALITKKIDSILEQWKYKLDNKPSLFYYKHNFTEESLLIPIQDAVNEGDILVAMQSMRSVEPSTEILIKQY